MQFLTSKQTCLKIAASRATLDRLVAAGAFPKPIRLSVRRLAYNADAVEEWMLARMEAA